MGSNGSAVKALQKNLNTLIKAKLTVDGEFGTATYNAVIKFQTKYKLTADGIVGENTQKKINSLLKRRIVPLLLLIQLKVLSGKLQQMN